ncbi:protein kinase domain protein, partial [Ichthyophthirius multifiliis]
MELEETEQDLEDQNLKNILIPFAIINEVTPESPAHESGIQLGDLIINFGSVNYKNHNDLKNIVDHIYNITFIIPQIYIRRSLRRQLNSFIFLTMQLAFNIKINQFRLQLISEIYNRRTFLNRQQIT